jgi:hypothetical protein
VWDIDGHLNGEVVQFMDFMWKNAENGKINSLKSYFEKMDFCGPYKLCKLMQNLAQISTNIQPSLHFP